MTAELGLNLAGVERVLELEEQLERTQRKVDALERSADAAGGRHLAAGGGPARGPRRAHPVQAVRRRAQAAVGTGRHGLTCTYDARSMASRRIEVEDARSIASGVLERAGLTAEEAAAVADIVIWTELTGYPQIGLARLPRLAEYVRRVDRAPIRIERDGPFSAHLEAGKALGYVTALKMVEVCEAKVRATGVGLVTANGSGLTGRNAYYVERLAEQGWVAFMVNNFPAVVAPHGSSEALFGTNPLSVAMPTTGPPMVVDISAARSSTRICASTGSRGARCPTASRSTRRATRRPMRLRPSAVP